MQAYVTTCKLMELHACSWNCMQGHGTSCKLIEMPAAQGMHTDGIQLYIVRILFLFIFVIANCPSSRQSPVFRSEKSRCNSVSTVSISVDMSQLSQFSFVYCNGGRRQHTHKRLVDIQGILTKHAPHGLFIAESLLDIKTERSLRHDGFNIETLMYQTKEKRIWAAVRNDTPYKWRSDLEKKHIAAIWLEFGSGRNRFLVCGYYREHKLLGIPNYTAPVNKTCAFVQRLLEALKNNLEIKVR